jgi:hypothetical protein
VTNSNLSLREPKARISGTPTGSIAGSMARRTLLAVMWATASTGRN